MRVYAHAPAHTDSTPAAAVPHAIDLDELGLRRVANTKPHLSTILSLTA